MFWILWTSPPNLSPFRSVCPRSSLSLLLQSLQTRQSFNLQPIRFLFRVTKWGTVSPFPLRRNEGMERERENKTICKGTLESLSLLSSVLPASPHFRGLKSSVSIRGVMEIWDLLGWPCSRAKCGHHEKSSSICCHKKLSSFCPLPLGGWLNLESPMSTFFM